MKHFLTLIMASALLPAAAFAQSVPGSDVSIGTATGSEMTARPTGGKDDNSIELYSGEQLQAENSLGEKLLLKAGSNGAYWTSADNGQSWASATAGSFTVRKPNGEMGTVVVH